jgi:hypothetical protein
MRRVPGPAFCARYCETGFQPGSSYLEAVLPEGWYDEVSNHRVWFERPKIGFLFMHSNISSILWPQFLSRGIPFGCSRHSREAWKNLNKHWTHWIWTNLVSYTNHTENAILDGQVSPLETRNVPSPGLQQSGHGFGTWTWNSEGLDLTTWIIKKTCVSWDTSTIKLDDFWSRDVKMTWTGVDQSKVRSGRRFLSFFLQMDLSQWDGRPWCRILKWGEFLSVYKWHTLW